MRLNFIWVMDERLMMCFCELCLCISLCVYFGIKTEGRPNDRVACTLQYFSIMKPFLIQASLFPTIRKWWIEHVMKTRIKTQKEVKRRTIGFHALSNCGNITCYKMWWTQRCWGRWRRATRGWEAELERLIEQSHQRLETTSKCFSEVSNNKEIEGSSCCWCSLCRRQKKEF